MDYSKIEYTNSQILDKSNRHNSNILAEIYYGYIYRYESEFDISLNKLTIIHSATIKRRTYNIVPTKQKTILYKFKNEFEFNKIHYVQTYPETTNVGNAMLHPLIYRNQI